MSNIVLRNVRLSFPHLWEAKAAQGGGTPKFSASLLLDKATNAKDIAAIRAAMTEVGKAKWPAGIPKGCTPCLKEGNTKDYDGYDDSNMFVSASSDKRPVIVDTDPTVALVEADGKPYAGCTINASIRLWAQDNQFGKRINAQLTGIQFVEDGEAFGDAPLNPVDVFGAVAGKPSAKSTTKPEATEAAADDDIPW